MRPSLALALALVSFTACGQVRAIDDSEPDAAVDEPDAAPEPDAEPALACSPVFARTDLISSGAMVTEGFESSPVPPASFDDCFGPLSSATSAPCAQPGAVRPGFALADEFNDARIYGDGFMPGAFGRWSGPAGPDRVIEIRFDTPRTRVGFDLIADTANTMTVTAFGDFGAILGQAQLNAPTGQLQFFGTACNQPGIVRVVINPSFGLVLVDQLSFDDSL
jgi:hypothetical protein